METEENQVHGHESNLETQNGKTKIASKHEAWTSERYTVLNALGQIG